LENGLIFKDYNFQSKKNVKLTSKAQYGCSIKKVNKVGKEVHLKMGLSVEGLKRVISIRGNFTPLKERRKYLGRARLRDGSYSCPMCEEMDDSLYYF